MEKQLFFRATMAGLGKYRTDVYGRIGVYRVKVAVTCKRTKILILHANI